MRPLKFAAIAVAVAASCFTAAVAFTFDAITKGVRSIGETK